MAARENEGGNGASGGSAPEGDARRRQPAPPTDRPPQFPQKVDRRILAVAWEVIWPWVIMLLVGALLLLLRELLKSWAAGGPTPGGGPGAVCRADYSEKPASFAILSGR